MNSKMKNSGASFFLSAICVTIIFGLLRLIGGSLSLFQGDDFQQYLVFIKDFINIIRGEGSVWYSFANYIGSGNILNIAYYCLSPFNVFFFLCGDNFFLAYFLIVVLKLSLAAAAFYFFISDFNGKDRLFYVIASVFYALSGYAIIWYLDIMWLEALYILPLLISLIVRYIKKGNYILLILIYAYLFVTNFYMGFIVGIFSALFFISYLLYAEDYKIKENLKSILKKSTGFFGIVVLAAGMCAGLLLSAAGFLSEHMAHDNVEFTSLIANLFDIVNSMFIGEFQTMDNRVPMLYAGIPVFALLFFFYINKKIDIKEKIFWGIQLLFYVTGMLILPLYKFLHAFDYPNFYGYRFSFIVVFIMVSIACIAVDYLDDTSSSFFKIFVIIAPVFYSVMMTFQAVYFAGNRLNSQSGLLLNFMFILLWFAVYRVYFVKQRKDKLIRTLALLLALVEVVVNGCICIKNTDFVHIEKSLINGWYYSEKKAIEDIKGADDSFYRVYVNNDVNTNSGKMFGYNGLNTFSSADNYDLRMALCRLGQSTSNRYMRSNCSVPGFDSLFSVKYRVGLPKYEDYMYVPNINSENVLPTTVEVNEEALSLGYMVSPDILTYTFSTNAFDNIERLCASMTGEYHDIYRDIILEEENIELLNYEMHVLDGRMYFNNLTDLYNSKSGVAFVVPEYSENRYLEFSYNSPGSYYGFPVVYTDEEGAYHSKKLAEGGVYKMGKLEGGNYVTITGDDQSDSDFFINAVYIADFDAEEFSYIYENLASNQYNVMVNTSDVISGTVTATEDKPYLFTTIPYDPEWHVYVDGKPITKMYRVVGDAFMAIELTPGEHTVTFQYVEKWSNEGMIISLISISAFCILVLMNLMSQRRKNSEKAEASSAGEAEK